MAPARILLVSPYLPYADIRHAGGKFIRDFMVHLRKKGEKIYLVCFVTPDEQKYTEEVRRMCDDHCFLLRRGAVRGKLSKFFSEHPFLGIIKLLLWVFEKHYFTYKLSKSVSEMADKHNVDALQVEYSRMGIFLRKIDFNGLKILDLHDVMIKPAAREYRSEKNIVKKIFRYLNFLSVKNMEIAFCRKFDVLLTKSELDKGILERYGNFNIKVVPLGLDVVPGTKGYENREDNSVMFVGSMKRRLNEEAALYFITKVLPLIKKELNGIKFYVIGDEPSERLKKYSSENVIITGYVEDLSIYYNKCKVFVAPLFTGGGMIYKIQESMNFGVPVVATSIANEGILACNGLEILIADNPDGFCVNVLNVLKDKGLWEDLSRQAKKFIEDKFSWEKVIEQYLFYK